MTEMIKQKTIILAGFGQMGKAALPLINRSHIRVLGFADNDEKKLTPDLALGPAKVMLPKEAVSCKPDLILLCPISRERSLSLKEQFLTLGYDGSFLFLTDLYTSMDIRGAVLIRMAARLKEQCVAGAIAELGVYRGATASLLSGLFPDRTLYLFDTFEGFDRRDTETERNAGYSFAEAGEFADTSDALVLKKLPVPEKAVIRKGYFPETAVFSEELSFALVSLDADLYEPTLEGLRYFYPRLSPGGCIVLHDYDNLRFQGVRRAVREFEKAEGSLNLIPLPDLHGSCVILRPF